MAFPDYPFDSHYATVNGHQMHYLDEGSGGDGPLVMVHGNPSWSFFFRHLVAGLRDAYRCVVPDHIGMGLSAKPSGSDYSFALENRVDDLQALLGQIGITENITLILHDWGGMIGMGLACRRPESIKRLVIMNTAAFHLPAGKQIPWQLKLARSFIGPVLVRGFNAFCRGAVRSCVTRGPMTQTVKQAYLGPYDNWEHRHGVLRFVQDIPLKQDEPSFQLVSDIENDIQQFNHLPMLICWGLRDFVFDINFLQAWERRFPHAEIHRFNDAGHYLLEDAHREVTPLVQGFLKNNPI